MVRFKLNNWHMYALVSSLVLYEALKALMYKKCKLRAGEAIGTRLLSTLYPADVATQPPSSES